MSLVLTETAPCSVVACIDVTKEAGSYAQLAGVLAGFAFAALALILSIWLTSANPPRRETIETVTQAFLASTISLCVATWIATEVASEVTNGGRAATTSGILGLALSTGAMSIFYSLTLLMMHVRVIKPLMLGRWISGVVLPVAFFQFESLASDQMNVHRHARKMPVADIELLTIMSTMVLLAVLIYFLYAGTMPRLDRLCSSVPIVTCVFGLFCAAAQTWIMRMPSDYVPPRWVDYAGVPLVGVAYAFIGISATRLRVPGPDRPPPSGQ